MTNQSSRPEHRATPGTDINASKVDTSEDCHSWGHREQLASGQRFKFQSFVVVPGGKFSVHRPVDRSEHWIDVEGRAQISKNGSATWDVEDLSISLPPGETLSFENPGSKPIRLIEIQTGSRSISDKITPN